MTTTEILKGRLENKPGVIGATIITGGGSYFDFVNPRPDQLAAEDIAWGLAHQCRFGGQTDRTRRGLFGRQLPPPYYSVAQHCVLGARMAPTRRLAWVFLMHEIAEAVMGDMVGPLKQLCPEFKGIEKRTEAALLPAFGIDPAELAQVKSLDLRMLRTEQRDLTAGRGDDWNGLDAYPAFQWRIKPWSRHRAAREWLSAFRRLSPPPGGTHD